MIDPQRVVNKSKPPDPKTKYKSRMLRERSMPPNRGFRSAASLALLHYFATLAALVTVVVAYLQPEKIPVIWIGGAVGAALLTWIISYLKRRDAICPLCRGTPLVNSQARVNERAERFLSLNHGVTAVLSILATQTFRCMYCGSKFDLLKRSSHRTSSKDRES
ncbi:MAG: hypothetical protein RLZZ245_483 [Verrucomicrobiota bacterium]